MRTPYHRPTLGVITALCLALLSDPLLAGPFKGHRVVSVTVTTERELDLLKSLAFNVWSCEIGLGRVDVQVTPEQFDRLQKTGLPFSVMIEDVDPLVERQYVQLRGASWHESYHPLSEIETRLAEHVANYPAIAFAQTFGNSLEGRTLHGIRITGPGNGPDKPAFFFHGGQHAREWVSPATVMWIIDWLLTNYGSDPLATRLIDEMEWFILPVMNPDGYVYTWASPSNRMWRKNRRNNGDGTFGVDLNRNWGVGWGGVGSSGTTSEDIYRGPSPFSEPETQSLRNFVLAHPNIVAYIDFHSYSELILWPWGYTDVLSSDEAAFSEIGLDMQARLQDVHGHVYDAGPTYTTIYPASGIGSDWAYGNFAADRLVAAFGIELRDTGLYGFVLPPEQIVPTAEENLQAVLALARAMSEPVRVQMVPPLPTSVRPGQTFVVTAEILPGWNGAATAEAVSLFHRNGAASFTETSMVSIGAGRFEATMVASSCEAPFEFYVRAAAGASAGYYPGFAPQEFDSLPVQSGSDVVLFDDLEAESSWTVGNAGDTAVSGVWVRVDPIGTAAQPEDDHTPAPGTQCYVTGQGPLGGTVGQADVDGGPTTLLSPIFSIPDDDYTISYARWFSNDQGSNPNEDAMNVSVSNNAGASWVTAETVNTNANAWVVHGFTPADVGLAATGQMRLRFTASDVGGGSIVEAGIDDLRVFRPFCTPADGDADGDQDVSLTDHAFIAECLAGPSVHSVSTECAVFNLDYDTDVDMDDYLLFVQRFGVQ